ncbi:MAG TPA: hypothetical protein PKI86_05715 [Chitinophagales bacterium]|nr:hypothetical protein [Chitinophagales bacterium]
MKHYILLFTLFFVSIVNCFSQNSTVNPKLNYPDCSLINESFITEKEDVNAFVIKSQEEFDRYFKFNNSYKINFENSMVLVGFVGKNNSNKNININGATYNTRKAILYVKRDLRDKPIGTCGKYCVVVIQKMEYKKILFLNSKKYNRSQRRKDLLWG